MLTQITLSRTFNNIVEGLTLLLLGTEISLSVVYIAFFSTLAQFVLKSAIFVCIIGLFCEACLVFKMFQEKSMSFNVIFIHSKKV